MMDQGQYREDPASIMDPELNNINLVTFRPKEAISWKTVNMTSFTNLLFFWRFGAALVLKHVSWQG